MKVRSGSISRNVSIATSVNLLAVILGSASSILAARLLGPQGRGELAAATQWPTTIGSFGSIGMTVAIVYYCSYQREKSGEYYASAFFFLLILILPCMIAGYFLLPYLLAAQNNLTIGLARLYLFIVPIMFVEGLPHMALQGLEEFDLWNILRSLPPIIWIFIWLYIWIRGVKSVEQIIAIHLLVMYSLIFPFQIVALKKLKPPYRPSLKKCKELLIYGIPSLFTNIPMQMNYQLDQLMIAAFLPSKQLGLYAVAVALGIVFTPALQAIGQIIFPRLALTDKSGVSEDLLKKAFHIGMIIGLGLLVLIMPITPLLIIVIFGREFAGAIGSAVILVPASLIRSLNIMLEDLLRGLGKPKYPMYAEIAGLVATICLLLVLLPMIGIIGAALSSLVSYSITFSLNIAFIEKETHLGIRALLRPEKEDYKYIGSIVRRRSLR